MLLTPNGQVGKEANITIDGEFSDWSEDMCIAQGMANDSPVKFKGDWENCVIDSYSLYAAWDDSNLYVAWQNVNTADICNGQGGALNDGRLRDLHQFLAFDTGNGNNLNGKCTDGKGIWGNDITYETPVTHVLAVHADGSLTPGFFTAVDDGLTDYKAHCGELKELGIEFGTSYNCFPSKLMGIYQIPGTPEGVEMLYDSTQPVDLLTKGTHSKAEDQFFEVKVPFSALGITKDEFLANGVGILQLGARGESAIDCVPHDKCMLDNVWGNYARETSNSHEKDDNDIITVPLAKAGKDTIPNPKPKFSSFDSDVKSPQKVNSSINFTAAATSENGAVTYEYKIDGTTVQDYSSNGTYTWTPSKAGTYKVTVTAKDTASMTSYREITYVIDDGPVDGPTINSFTSNLPSPQGKNTPITFTTDASTSGNGLLNFKYYVNDELADSGSSKFIWTPEDEGVYTIKVEVTDENDKKATKSVNYEISSTGVLSITSIETSKKSAQACVNDSITLSADSTGAVGSVNYRFRVRLNGSIVEQSTISTSNTFEWTPTEEGTYTIEVFAQDDDCNTDTKTIDYIVKPNDTKLTITSATVNPQTTQVAGKPVTISAQAQGSGTIQYRFQIFNGSKLVAQSQASTVNSYKWTPTVEGNYTIKITVKDSTGATRVSSKSGYIVRTRCEFGSFTTNVASPQAAGTPIKLSVLATGSGTIKYKFAVYLGSKLVAQSNASTSKTYTWKPTVAGNYTLKVLAQDSSKTMITTTKNFTITKPEPIVINSLTSSVASPQNAGNTISFLTKATGKTTLQYQYWVYNIDGNWTLIKNYSTSNTASWKPSTAGNYIVWVNVKDANGNIKTKYINYKINEKVTKVENTSSAITYTGAWTNSSSTSFSGGSIKNATKEAKAQFTFTGTGLKMYALTGINKGMANITVDGVSYLSDLYSDSTEYKNLVFNKTGLSNSKHTVTIEYTGYSNINATGTAINIDYFEIVG